MGEQLAALVAGKSTGMDTIVGALLFTILIIAAFFLVILCVGESKKEGGDEYFDRYRKVPFFTFVATLVLYFASTHFVVVNEGLLVVHTIAGVLVVIIGLPVTLHAAYSKNYTSFRYGETPKQEAFIVGATATVITLFGALVINLVAGLIANAIESESQWDKTVTIQVDADGRKIEDTAPKTEISSITITTNETTGTMWYDGITWTEKDGNGNLVVRHSMLGDGDQRTLIKDDLNEGEVPYVEYFKDYKGKSAALDNGAPMCISGSEYAWTLDKAVPRCEKDSEYADGTVKSGNKRYSVIHIPRGTNDTLITMRSSGRERR
jgi:hypothetical protein